MMLAANKRTRLICEPVLPYFLVATFFNAFTSQVRANQKDLYYLTQLTDQLEEVARSVFGAS